MKTLSLISVIIVILALVCSPVLAISKTDLISQYKGQSSPTILPPIPTPSHIPSWYITPTPTPVWGPVIPFPTPAPTQVPTGSGTGTLLVTPGFGARVYLDGELKGVTPSPQRPRSFAVPLFDDYDGYNLLTLTGIPVGPHQLKVTKVGFPDYITSVIVTAGKTTHVIVPTQAPSNGSYSIDPDDIPSKKPNIYLYSDRDLTAQVRLSPERAITVSEPIYRPGKGWLAQIRDGSLNGAGDFLFYEALVPDSVWQKKEGFVIHAASREQDMAFMLGEYGFNEKETRDFIDYWAKYLSGDGDYVFYPQETSAVDRVMPLSITPQPDYVSRIWFYAEPLVIAPEPVTSPETIFRDGFYVVEWGVITHDQYWIDHSPASSEVVL
jgi:hypothetical protein